MDKRSNLRLLSLTQSINEGMEMQIKYFVYLLKKISKLSKILRSSVFLKLFDEEKEEEEIRRAFEERFIS